MVDWSQKILTEVTDTGWGNNASDAEIVVTLERWLF